MCQCPRSNMSSATIRRHLYASKRTRIKGKCTRWIWSALTCLFVNRLGCFNCYAWQLSEQHHGAAWHLDGDVGTFWQAPLFQTPYSWATLATGPRSHEELDSNPSVWRRLEMRGYKSPLGRPWGGWRLSCGLNLNLVKNLSLVIAWHHF